jgi:hypothetical protein
MFGLLQESDYTPSEKPDKPEKDWLMIGEGIATAVVSIVFGTGVDFGEDGEEGTE